MDGVACASFFRAGEAKTKENETTNENQVKTMERLVACCDLHWNSCSLHPGEHSYPVFRSQPLRFFCFVGMVLSILQKHCPFFKKGVPTFLVWSRLSAKIKQSECALWYFYTARLPGIDSTFFFLVILCKPCIDHMLISRNIAGLFLRCHCPWGKVDLHSR